MLYHSGTDRILSGRHTVLYAYHTGYRHQHLTTHAIEEDRVFKDVLHQQF
jgi:hypothetical protein